MSWICVSSRSVLSLPRRVERTERHGIVRGLSGGHLETIRPVTETLLRLAKEEIDPKVVLVASDDVFEVPKVPSVVFQGPTLTENRDRRTMALLVERSIPDLTYQKTRAPRLYHLDFDVVVTAPHEGELLDLTEKVSRFYQLFPILFLAGRGSLNLTELVPVGGLARVNLSNLRQSTGRLRIEDCPIYDGHVETGKLIRDRIFDVHGTVQEVRRVPPPPGSGESLP